MTVVEQLDQQKKEGLKSVRGLFVNADIARAQAKGKIPGLTTVAKGRAKFGLASLLVATYDWGEDRETISKIREGAAAAMANAQASTVTN